MPTRRDVHTMLLTLPETTEVVVPTWGDQPTFRVRNKIFALLRVDSPTVCLKATRDDQAALLDENPDVFRVPPYFGRWGWVDVVIGRVDPDQLAELIEEAWRLTAPKRVVAAYDRDRDVT